MITTTRLSPTRTTAACLAAMICLLLVSATLASAAESTINYKPESYSTFQQQLASGKVKAVTINKHVRSLRTTLTDGSYVLAKYAAHEEPKVAAALQAKGVSVTVLAPAEAAKQVSKKPVKHKLRYIAGGILIVVIIVVGAVLLVDRRRKLAAE
jgi:ATP-dependent Zn protease